MQRLSELFLLIISIIISIVVAVKTLDFLRPGLIDAFIARTQPSSDRSFLENVFTPGVGHPDFIIKEDYTHRARQLDLPTPFWGPTDLLGFRNHSIPNRADVITIGDSQTFGNNAMLSRSWPYAMLNHMDDFKPKVYSMAVGGWGPLDYLLAFKSAIKFKPKTIVVAFYTGNDPIDSYKHAYGTNYWAAYRFDDSLTIDDTQPVEFPPLEHDRWTVNVHGNSETVLTPEYRGINVLDDAVTDVSYKIMERVAEQISEACKSLGIDIIFTIIPTKEYVYSDYLEDKAKTIPKYVDLIAGEKKRIGQLKTYIESLDHAAYVDLSTPLKRAAFLKEPLYPSDFNGHPIEHGYDVIARTLAPSVMSSIKKNYSGPVWINLDDSNGYFFFLEPGSYIKAIAPVDILAQGHSIDGVPIVPKSMLEGRTERKISTPN